MTPIQALDVLVGIARDAAGETAQQCRIDDAEQVLRAPREQARKPSRPVRLDAKGRACARKAADLLTRAFVWEDTAEGGTYWAGLNDRLFQIAKDGVL